MAKGESWLRYTGDEYSDSGRQRVSARAAACDNSMVEGVREMSMSLVLGRAWVGDFSKKAAKHCRQRRQSRSLSKSIHLGFALSCFIYFPICAMAYNNYPRMFDIRLSFALAVC